MASLRYYFILGMMMLLTTFESWAQEEGEEATVAATEESTTTTPPQQQDSPPPPPPRFRPKVWYLSNVKLGGSLELPIDYVTLVVGLISFFVLYRGLRGGPQPSCTASHILMDNHDDATREKLEKLRDTIGTDASMFALVASKHSTCPSKAKGGMLGKFPRGAMVPVFDKTCFDPQTPEGTAVGPVHSHFGYHLIFIHERTLPPE